MSQYVLEDRQRDSKAKLSCNIGQRISCGFTSQGGASGKTGIYLDDVVLGDKQNILGLIRMVLVLDTRYPCFM